MYVSDMHPNPIPTNPYHIKHIAFVFCHFFLGTIISPAHELRRIWQQISQLMGITHGRYPIQINTGEKIEEEDAYCIIVGYVKTGV